jgi:hypothetical protein
MRRKYHYGRNIRKYIEKRKKDLNKTILLKQCFFLRGGYLKKWRLLTKNPMVTIGFIAMKILEFAVAGIDMIRGYMTIEVC